MKVVHVTPTGEHASETHLKQLNAITEIKGKNTTFAVLKEQLTYNPEIGDTCKLFDGTVLKFGSKGWFDMSNGSMHKTRSIMYYGKTIQRNGIVLIKRTNRFSEWRLINRRTIKK